MYILTILKLHPWRYNIVHTYIWNTVLINTYRISRNIDSDFNLVITVKIAKLIYAIINPFILQTWVFLHTVMKSTNLKSHQQSFLSKPPNIMFAYISTYMVPYSANAEEYFDKFEESKLHYQNFSYQFLQEFKHLCL